MLTRGNRNRVTESTGALSTDTVRMLLALAKQASAPTTHDSTCYGTARTSPRCYFAHHVAAISAAIVCSCVRRRRTSVLRHADARLRCHDVTHRPRPTLTVHYST